MLAEEEPTPSVLLYGCRCHGESAHQLSFDAEEFLGLTLSETHSLRHLKDNCYLEGREWDPRMNPFARSLHLLLRLAARASPPRAIPSTVPAATGRS
jgi:hypothetical protein